MVRSRILQIAINSILFALMAIVVVDLVIKATWQFDGGDVRAIGATLAYLACLAALAGSVCLNIQILRNSRSYSPSRSFLTHLCTITFAIVLLCIALERRSIASLAFDSHLSTHYMYIQIPVWLQFGSVAEAFSIQDLQILNLLGYLMVISLFVMMKYFGPATDNSNIPNNKVNPTLIKYQIALGIIFLLLAVICLISFIENLTAFRALVEFDPGVMNLSNIAGFGFQLLNFVLLVLYGQWILRDGLTLRTNIVNAAASCP